MFADAVGILALEAERCGKSPLYEQGDIEHALSRWRVVDYHVPTDIGDNVSFSFLDAGHILGSAMVRFERAGKVLVCTGDLGNSPDTLLRDTESIKGANYLLTESVYGDRNHEGRDHRREVLREAIEEVRTSRGVLVIPSFSLQRTQVLLSEIGVLIASGMQPIPIFLDSPLAISVLDIYRKHAALFNDAAQKLMQTRDIFDFSGLHTTMDVHDSSAITEAPNPKVIIAGAGMSHGGRVRTHELHYLPDRNATILFVGYQAVGSLGRRIKDGAKKVEIDGTWVKVRARVREVHGYSAHKDGEHILAFIEEAQDSLEKIFVAMGEPRSALFLTQRIRDFLGLDAVAPAAGEIHEISF
jgi:metallo-beta-lactamase family protein